MDLHCSVSPYKQLCFKAVNMYCNYYAHQLTAQNRPNYCYTSPGYNTKLPS